MKLYERIELIAQRKCGSRKRLAELLGEKQNTFNAYFSDERQDKFKAVHLERILDLFPDVNAYALITGEGDLFSKDPSKPQPDFIARNEEGSVTLVECKQVPGPVAERVDGIERAAKDTPLIDLIAFVIKDLRSWYNREIIKEDLEAREPEGKAYAQERSQTRKSRIEDDPPTVYDQMMTLGQGKPPNDKRKKDSKTTRG